MNIRGRVWEWFSRNLSHLIQGVFLVMMGQVFGFYIYSRLEPFSGFLATEVGEVNVGKAFSLLVGFVLSVAFAIVFSLFARFKAQDEAKPPPFTLRKDGNDVVLFRKTIYGTEDITFKGVLRGWEDYPSMRVNYRHEELRQEVRVILPMGDPHSVPGKPE